MKEIYDIIIVKLEHDLKIFENELEDNLYEVDKEYAERVWGKKIYCEDLIEFFTDVRNNL